MFIQSLLAASAAADFTPSPGPVLQGHFSQNPSTSILAPLEARALILSTADSSTQHCLLTLDVIGVSRDTTARIRSAIHRATGIPPHHILIAASHTHCAPATVDLLGMTPDPAFLHSLELACLDCATRAIQSLRPATLGLGCSSANFNVNRRPLPGATTQFSVNHAGIVDRRVRVLRIADALTNHPISLLFHYSCHPTTLPGSLGQISPDFPGLARTRIERLLPDCHALFLPGCFGNIRPHIVDSAGQFTSATPAQLHDLATQLSDAVLRAAATISSETTTLDAREIPLTLPFASPTSPAAIDAILAESTPVARLVKHPWVQRLRQSLSTNSLPSSETTSMQLLKIGPLTLITIPGEPAQEIGHAIEREAASLAPDLWPVGYANDMLGYLVTERQKLEGGYEPNAFPLFNRPAPFASEEHHIIHAAKTLLASSDRRC